ncbi:Phosphatidylinositol 4-kinase alpha [Trichinella spiralis]|uniref:Phosphatidylinositol 4-kinase alpha n=1 Tax=Trichinella spiralis TaxID=6334 RepID=A0ABR3KU62_TRISP
MNSSQITFCCLHGVAYNLSKVPSVPWEKVERIFIHCPQRDADQYVVTNDALNALIALGIFCFESNFQILLA